MCSLFFLPSHVSPVFFLSSAVPPQSIELVGHSAGSRIDITEHEEVELTCKVANAKPAAAIAWFRNGAPFSPEDETTSEESGTVGDRKTTKSTIKFRPTARDNKASIACEAQHRAILSGPMRVAVGLSVHCK